MTFQRKEGGRDLEWEVDDERGEGRGTDPAQDVPLFHSRVCLCTLKCVLLDVQILVPHSSINWCTFGKRISKWKFRTVVSRVPARALMFSRSLVYDEQEAVQYQVNTS